MNVKKNNKDKNLALSDSSALVELLVHVKNIRIEKGWNDHGRICLVISMKNFDHSCPSCHQYARVKDRPCVTLIDLLCFDQPTRLMWRKHRLTCTNPDCEKKSWVITHPRLSSQHARISTRAARWCVQQVCEGKTITQIARELHCDWHTVNKAVTLYGQELLRVDTKRIHTTHVIGLDETRFLTANPTHRTHYVTTLADLDHHTIIDVIPSRDSRQVAHLLASYPRQWRHAIQYGCLDLSLTYRSVYRIGLPHARLVADHFHVIQLANRTLDSIRRRIQQENWHHRGRKTDPLYQVRRLLVRAEERLTDPTLTKLTDALHMSNDDGSLTLAWHVKEALRRSYTLSRDQAHSQLEQIEQTCKKDSSPYELHKLGNTLKEWHEEILNYHDHSYSNGPTEGLNNHMKKVKRDAYGFTNFANYRLRILLQYGGVNKKLLKNIIIP